MTGEMREIRRRFAIAPWQCLGYVQYVHLVAMFNESNDLSNLPHVISLFWKMNLYCVLFTKSHARATVIESLSKVSESRMQNEVLDRREVPLLTCCS